MQLQTKIINKDLEEKEIKNLKLEWEVFKKEAIKNGKILHNFIKDYIKRNTQTSNASNVHLADNIDFDYSDKGMILEIGIGTISILNQVVPWWYLVNYGGNHPMAGNFLPGYWSSIGKKWIYDPGSNVGVKISENAFIDGMNYIENTEAYGDNLNNNLINKFKIKEG